MKLVAIATALSILVPTAASAEITSARVVEIYNDARETCAVITEAAVAGSKPGSVLISEHSRTKGYNAEEESLLLGFCTMYVRGYRDGVSRTR